MYKYNPTPAHLTDEKQKEIFSIENFKKLIKNLNEKKENEDMRNEKDLLVDSLIQKQVSILNKIQLVDEKAAAYHLSEQGEVIQQFIDSLNEAEKQIDDSLESFEKTEDSIVRAWDRIREDTIEVWSKMQEDFEKPVAVEEDEDNETKIEVYDMFDDWNSKKVSVAIKKGYEEPEEDSAVEDEPEKVTQTFNGDLEELNQLLEEKDKALSRAVEQAKKKRKELANKETVHVKMDIQKHEQFMVRSTIPDFLLSYVITDENEVTRGGKKIIDPKNYEGGVITDFAVELIEIYEEALLKGDTISYTGEFTL